MRYLNPDCHLHVFGYDSPETVKHRIFRDWLRAHADDRCRYAEVKREAATLSRAAGEHGMEYNARKEAIMREIYRKAFIATGLLKLEEHSV